MHDPVWQHILIIYQCQRKQPQLKIIQLAVLESSEGEGITDGSDRQLLCEYDTDDRLEASN